MIITVLGPDGSGKSTLAEKLSDDLHNLEYIYFGNNVDSRKYKYFSNFLYAQKKGKLNTLLKYLFVFINDYYYYKLAKKKNLIADRCPIDKLLGSKVNNMKGRLLYHKWSLKLMPKPDFAILLTGNSEILYARTKEIPIPLIEGYISFYRNYLTKHNIKFVEIDTVENDISETFNIAKDIIKELL